MDIDKKLDLCVRQIPPAVITQINKNIRWHIINSFAHRESHRLSECLGQQIACILADSSDPIVREI